MKKILISIFALLFSYSMANAAVNIGISMSAGGFTASGTEDEAGEKSTEDAAGAASYGSIFIEKTLGEKITLGFDYVPSSLDTETTETIVDDIQDKSETARTQRTNTVKASFTDLTTLYVNFNVNENLYLKLGRATVDVATKESLATGSSYGDADMDGTVMGLGYHNQFDNGMFVRFEGQYMDLGGFTLTSESNSDNKVTLDDLQGVAGAIKIGKSF